MVEDNLTSAKKVRMTTACERCRWVQGTVAHCLVSFSYGTHLENRNLFLHLLQGKERLVNWTKAHLYHVNCIFIDAFSIHVFWSQVQCRSSNLWKMLQTQRYCNVWLDPARPRSCYTHILYSKLQLWRWGQDRLIQIGIRQRYYSSGDDTHEYCRN